MSLLNDPDDIKWVKETYLKNRQYPEFNSFVLMPDELNVMEVHLYSDSDPHYLDVPTIINVCEEPNNEA